MLGSGIVRGSERDLRQENGESPGTSGWVERVDEIGRRGKCRVNKSYIEAMGPRTEPGIRVGGFDWKDSRCQ